MTLDECAALLRENDGFLILTHKRPDGDTLGCAAALVRGLRRLGKNAFILENPETTPRYLPYVEEFYAPGGYSPDFVVSVDTASVKLFPENALPYQENVALSIDHHPSNTGFARRTLIDHRLAACGELMYRLLLLLGPVDRDMATALYIALSTDTGCFSYGNTTADTLTAAGELVRLGANLGELNRALFRAKSLGRVAVEGMVYTQMEFLLNGRAVVLVLTNDMLDRAGAEEDDLENIAAVPVSVDGVMLGVTIRELREPGEFKVSVRSGPGVDANAFASRFGGGGHAGAAGFARRGPVEKIREHVVATILDFLP